MDVEKQNIIIVNDSGQIRLKYSKYMCYRDLLSLMYGKLRTQLKENVTSNIWINEEHGKMIFKTRDTILIDSEMLRLTGNERLLFIKIK